MPFLLPNQQCQSTEGNASDLWIGGQKQLRFEFSISLYNFYGATMTTEGCLQVRFSPLGHHHDDPTCKCRSCSLLLFVWSGDILIINDKHCHFRLSIFHPFAERLNHHWKIVSKIVIFDRLKSWAGYHKNKTAIALTTVAAFLRWGIKWERTAAEQTIIHY